MLFILEKERKVRSTDCKLKCFFLPNISLPHTPQGVLTGFYGILNRRNYVLIVNNFIIQLSGTSIFGCRETEAYLHMVYISREVTSNQKQIIEATQKVKFKLENFQKKDCVRVLFHFNNQIFFVRVIIFEKSISENSSLQQFLSTIPKAYLGTFQTSMMELIYELSIINLFLQSKLSKVSNNFYRFCLLLCRHV